MRNFVLIVLFISGIVLRFVHFKVTPDDISDASEEVKEFIASKKDENERIILKRFYSLYREGLLNFMNREVFEDVYIREKSAWSCIYVFGSSFENLDIADSSLRLEDLVMDNFFKKWAYSYATKRVWGSLKSSKALPLEEDLKHCFFKIKNLEYYLLNNKIYLEKHSQEELRELARKYGEK